MSILRGKSLGNNQEQGVALITALVFLLVLTILGVTAMSSSNLQEKMAFNTKDRNLAFQSAETALAAAEQWLMSSPQQVFPNLPQGMHVAASCPVIYEEVWECVDWTGATVRVYPALPDNSSAGDNLSFIASQPRYLIEELQVIPNPDGTRRADGTSGDTVIYRITARGTGGTDQSVVMLQSNVARNF